MSEENENLWVVFDGYGEQIFTTKDEIYANFDFMQRSEYNIQECTIIKNPVDENETIIKDLSSTNIFKILPNGRLRKITISKDFRGNNRNEDGTHIPAPNNSKIPLHSSNQSQPETR